MAHTGMLFDFVSHRTAKMNSWRFFFEEAIEIHPDVSVAEARLALAKGLDLGSGDGIVFLGICGPGKAEDRPQIRLASGIVAERTSCTCTHACGVTKWRAEGMLSHIDTVKLNTALRAKGYMFYDYITRAYGTNVTKAWILGMNLRSPVPDVNHRDLIDQDRLKYPQKDADSPH